MLFLLPDELKISGMELLLFYQFTVENLHLNFKLKSSIRAILTCKTFIPLLRSKITGYFAKISSVYTHHDTYHVIKLENSNISTSDIRWTSGLKFKRGHLVKVPIWTVLWFWKSVRTWFKIWKKLNYEACRILQRPIDVPRLKLLESVSTLIASYPAGRI